jgi:hypothetical protein
MRAYLDAFMTSEAKKIRRLLRQQYGMSKREAKAMTDFGAVRDLCERVVNVFHLIGDMPEHAIERCAMMMAIAPFFRVGTDAPGSIFAQDRVAVHPAPELVEDFADARPPESGMALVAKALRNKIWHLDVPHYAVMLATDQQLRGIFANPFLTDDGMICISVVTTHPGTDREVTRMSWAMGTDDSIGIPVGIDPDHLRSSVEAFLSLVVLHYEFAKREDNPAIPTTRRGVEQARARVAKPRREKPKTFSLFRIHHMESPHDRFRRPRGTIAQGGWTLQWRTPVKGHFKMQHHGPGKILRKLIWVDGHERGPEDAPLRPRMDLLGRRRAAPPPCHP